VTKKAASKTSKPDSALNVLLNKLQQPQARQATLGAQYPSVFNIARSNTAQLLKADPLLHISEARSLHAQAIVMTAMVARQFREQRLTASVRQAVRNDSGIKGLVDAPTYSDMFNPDWASHCPPDAIEATTSPIAYLADLYREAAAVEDMADDQGRALKLADRRPDLAGLMLDHTALNRVEPTLVLVNEILHTSIRSYLDGISLNDKSVDDVLLETRYPFALPYERYQQQINYVLQRKDRLPGDPIRAADPAYPYFKQPGVHSLLSDIALIQDTGLGPVQQGLLVEAPHGVMAQGDADPLTLGMRRINPRNGRIESARASSISDFFKDNFGITDVYALTDTQTFCLRTGLSTDQLDELLSVGAYAPALSANVAGEAEVDGSAFGSVYINGGQSPAISIESSEENGAPVHRLINCSVERFDRMNRMIRLARWLDLPFAEVDQLLTAAQQAEHRAASVVRRTMQIDTPAAHLISQDTLRALGLFQVVRKRFDVPAEDFAAMLYGLSVHGRGKSQSQFDRVFNSQALFSIPLSLDDTLFNIVPANEAERQKVDHLCAALGMTYEMYRFVAKVVEQSWAAEPLRWTREVVSAFYRLVRLPRYIGLSTIEALALLELLNDGGSQLVAKLAGVPRIASYYASNNTDTLSVIHALVDCAAWLQDNQWAVAQLCRLVLPALTQPVATDAERNLLQQLHSRLIPALISDSSFAQIGAPDSSETLQTDDSGRQFYLSEPINWFEALSAFIDAGTPSLVTKGLVKHLNGVSEESFEQALGSAVEGVLEMYGLPIEELHPKITNMVMRARGAQEALLMEGLGGYLTTSADLAKALLFWSEGNRYQLLREVLRVFGNSTTATVPIGDEVLLVLDALSRRAVLCNHLTLSPALINQYVEHPDWFGLANTGLSLQSLYFLTQYANVLRLSEQSEDTLLDYFRLINTLWAGATEGDKRLIRDSAASKLAGFLRWGVRDVLAVALKLHPDDGVIFTLADFDVLARVCLLSRHAGLDANALLALHELTPTTSTELYRRAAELALSCLTDAPPASTVGEVGQSHTSVITVTPDYLVAQRESDIATYTITLRDFMDKPLEGISIQWATDLGVLDLDQPTSITDEDGQALMTLHSGNVMGIAHVVAEYGLGEKLMAPVVVIDCDEESLHFVDGQYEPSTALAGKLQPINFWVTMIDNYNNKGIDRAVAWSATLGEFMRYQTYTNQQGEAHAELRSRSEGTSTVVAMYKSGHEWEFIDVHFIDIPYFQYVRFNGTVVTGIETLLTCSLVALDGTPVLGKTVTWSADVDGLLETQSTTDSNGIASTLFKGQQEGVVVVTVSAADPVIDKNSAQTTIHPVVTIERYEASSDEFLVGSADPMVFSVWLKAGEQPATRYPVEWQIDGGSIASSKTDAGGMATFSSKFQTGRHTVRANVGGVDVFVDFPVFAMPPCEFSIERLEDSPGYAYDPAAPDLLARPFNHILIVKVIGQEGEPLEGVEFRLDHEYQPLDYTISNVGQVMVSSLEGTRYGVLARKSAKCGDIEIVLSGRLPKEFRKTYKLGWVYRLAQVSLWKFYEKVHVSFGTGEPGYDGGFPETAIPVNPYQLTFTCVSKGWAQATTLSYLGNTIGHLFDVPLGAGLEVADIVECATVVVHDGYAVITGAMRCSMPYTMP